MTYRDPSISTEPCPGCEREVPLGTAVCPHCASPIDVDQYAELELKLRPHMRAARTFLGVVAALGIGAMMFAGAIGEGDSVAGHAVPALFFAACFLASFRMPLGASIAAMAMLLFLQAEAFALYGLMGLVPGLIVKVILFVLLVTSIRAGYRARDLRGQWRRGLQMTGAAVLAGSVVLGLLLGYSVGA